MAEVLKFKYKSKVDYPVQVGNYWLAPRGFFIIDEDLEVDSKKVYKKEV